MFQNPGQNGLSAPSEDKGVSLFVRGLVGENRPCASVKTVSLEAQGHRQTHAYLQRVVWRLAVYVLYTLYTIQYHSMCQQAALDLQWCFVSHEAA